MRLEFELIPNLPRLAWAAHLRKDDPAVRILHGPWVETREDCFFEGACDGPFEGYRFHQAFTFLGSGARLADERVVFAGPTHTYESLHAVRADDEMFVSNSLAFLLALSGERPQDTWSFATYWTDSVSGLDPAFAEVAEPVVSAIR